MAVVIDHAKLAELFRSEDGAVPQALDAIAARVEEVAKTLAPVHTGKLRDSITHRLERDGSELVAIVGTPVPYASPVETGTTTAAPHPFLVPAAVSVTGQEAQAVTRLRNGTLR